MGIGCGFMRSNIVISCQARRKSVKSIFNRTDKV
jgi:hypothetical protein